MQSLPQWAKLITCVYYKRLCCILTTIIHGQKSLATIITTYPKDKPDKVKKLSLFRRDIIIQTNIGIYNIL